MSALPSSFFKHWVHSHEEDKEGLAIYHPSGYQFPLSRGRGGFEIKQDGEFILYGIGPADKPEPAVGHWTEEGPNRIKVSFEDPGHSPFVFEVVSSDEMTLVLRQQ
ncbi:MAG: hypothetical protein ACXV3D_02350 [Halobacteriota archaeon]